MTHTARNKVRGAVSVVFSFFLSLFLFLFVLLIIVQSTLLSEGYLREQMNKSNYYLHVIENLKASFESYGNASGFDKAFFEDFLDPSTVQRDVNQTISYLYGNGGHALDKQAFEDSMYDALVQDAQARGYSLTDQNQEALRYLAGTCAQTYEQYISMPYFDQISSLLRKLEKPVKYGIMGLGVFILFLAVFLFFVQRWKHRAFRSYLYAVGGAGLMLLLPPVAVLISGKIQRISFMTKSMYQLAVNYLTGICVDLLISVGALAVAVAMLAILYRQFKKRA